MNTTLIKRVTKELVRDLLLYCGFTPIIETWKRETDNYGGELTTNYTMKTQQEIILNIKRWEGYLECEIVFEHSKDLPNVLKLKEALENKNCSVNLTQKTDVALRKEIIQFINENYFDKNELKLIETYIKNLRNPEGK